MISAHLRLHRILFAVILIGNAVAFAGVDPVTRAVTAIIVVVLAAELREVPAIPTPHRRALIVVALLAAVQLLPLPVFLRGLVEPGLKPVLAAGWGTLSVAPWATLHAAAGLVVAVLLALTAARMARTRTGLPFVLATIAGTGAVIAVLGLAAETGNPGKVLLFRNSPGGAGPYGPFLNHNHFAVAIELTLPAALALLAAAARHLPLHGESRRRGAVMLLAAGLVAIIDAAALLRCGSRGGVLFLTAGLLLTLPFWMRRRRQYQWRWLVLAVVLVAGASLLAWNRVPELGDRFNELFVLEGVTGNTRLDLWAGTASLWWKSPFTGVGLGAYRYAIGVAKPPTGALILEQAHNDWLEWLADGGLLGLAALALFLAGLGLSLRPRRLGNLRFEYRYALAAAAFTMVAVGLHEVVGFGLQSPVNRYLFAAWIGLVWGLERSRHETADGRAPSGSDDVAGVASSAAPEGPSPNDDR